MGAFVIAEVGQAHEGSLGILHSYIDAVATTGVDAVKFQTHIADAESSPQEPFRVRFSYEDETRQDYWRRMGFSTDQWVEIKRHCEASGLEFMSTPACVSAVELLEKLGVRRYKIGSGDTDNRLLLHRVAKTGKQMILSTGLSTYSEIDAAVDFVSGFGNSVVIMQCTSEYPVAQERVGLNVIREFRARYSHPVGLSDHSGTIYPALAAVAIGATYIETHIVFDRRMFGPDSASSLTVNETKAMVAGIRVIEASLHSDFDKSRSSDRERVRAMFGKTLSLRRDMMAGEVVTLEDLESRKPAGMGIDARDYAEVIGKSLQRDRAADDFLEDADIG